MMSCPSLMTLSLQRQTLVLALYHRLCDKEISNSMDCCVRIAGARQYFARQYIRTELEARANNETTSSDLLVPFGEIYVQLLTEDCMSEEVSERIWRNIQAQISA